MLKVIGKSFGIAVVLFLCTTVSGATLIGTGTGMTHNSTGIFETVNGYTSTDCSGTAYIDGSSGAEVCDNGNVRSFAGWWGFGACSKCRP